MKWRVFSWKKAALATLALAAGGLPGLTLLISLGGPKHRPDLSDIDWHEPEVVERIRSKFSSGASRTLLLTLDDPRKRWEYWERRTPDERAELVRTHNLAFLDRNRYRLDAEQIRLLEEYIDAQIPDLYPPRHIVMESWRHPEAFLRCQDAQRNLMDIARRLRRHLSMRDIWEFSHVIRPLDEAPWGDHVLLIIDDVAFGLGGWHTYGPTKMWLDLRERDLRYAVGEILR